MPPPNRPVPPAAAGRRPPAKRPPARRQKSSALTWLLLPIAGAVALVLIAMLSAFGGYTSGINLRQDAEKTQVAGSIDEQYSLAMDDITQGQYYRARQRLEYVIKANPNYPGAADKLAEVLLELNTTATPTTQPTPTVTPTPDTRNVQDLFNQANQALLDSKWSDAMENLLQLRKVDPAYQAVNVDGMLFVALRNRGRDKILKEADLEGGIYDLTLAAKFGPLDAEAQGLLNWTTLYITGASFWGIDWEQAVNYFQQVAPNVPNLMDGSKMTATERLRQALFELGNQQASAGQGCKALKSYQESLAIAADPKVQQAAELASKGCEGGGGVGAGQTTETPKPGKKPKKTPSP
jgi:tetratricopeptide (TPR) repeat protein